MWNRLRGSDEEKNKLSISLYKYSLGSASREKKNRDERRSGQWWRVVCRRKSVFKWKIYFATCKESDILRWSNENFFRPTHDKLP